MVDLLIGFCAGVGVTALACCLVLQHWTDEHTRLWKKQMKFNNELLSENNELTYRLIDKQAGYSVYELTFALGIFSFAALLILGLGVMVALMRMVDVWW